MSTNSTNLVEPQDAADEIPEVRLEDPRFRVVGRGPQARREVARRVAIEPDLWPHFGSEEAVNAALRGLVEAARHMRSSG